MTICFQAEQRMPSNRGGLKRMRKEGRLPAIVFGTNMDSAMIHISSNEFQSWTRSGGAGIVELDIAGAGKVPVLLEGVQRDALTREFVHVDFLRVQKNEILKTKVAIDYIGTAKGTKLGGIVLTQSTTVEIEALPANLPSSIAVDISELDVGESLRVSDIALPTGVTLITPENEIIISVTTPRGAAEEELQTESDKEA